MKYTIIIEKYRIPGSHGIAEEGIQAKIPLPNGITEFEAAFRLGLLATALDFNEVSKADDMPRLYKSEKLRMGAYLYIEETRPKSPIGSVTEALISFHNLDDTQKRVFFNMLEDSEDDEPQNWSGDFPGLDELLKR